MIKGIKPTGAKEVLQSEEWIVKKVLMGTKGKVRIDAQRRFCQANGANFFSKWVAESYANDCLKEIGKKPLREWVNIQY